MIYLKYILFLCLGLEFLCLLVDRNSTAHVTVGARLLVGPTRLLVVVHSVEYYMLLYDLLTDDIMLGSTSSLPPTQHDCQWRILSARIERQRHNTRATAVGYECGHY